MTTLAAVDCGTNSIRLLIHDAATDTEITRQMEIVRLGQGVDETGRFQPEAIERTRVALEGYVEKMQRHGVTRVRMVATSATRDAANRDEFFTMTADLLGRIQPGVRAQVISGEEEAALSFRGATVDLAGHAREPYCVIDLGGGSTEFVMATASGLHAASTQMGCVRLTERFMHSDPPTHDEQDAARVYIRERIAEAETHVPLAEANTVVGCAGTFTTLAALAQGLQTYDPQAIHMSRIPFERMREVTAGVRGKAASIRAQHPVIHEGRADVIGAGAVVVEELMDAFERAGCTQFVVSEKDILDGIIASL